MNQFFSPRNLLRILWRRSLIVALVMAIGIPLSIWFALRQPRLYEAIAVIQIEAPQVIDSLVRTAGSGASADTELDLIQQKLTSRDHMTGVINRLGLYADVAVTPNDRVGLLRDAVNIAKLIDPTAAFRADVQASGLIITVRMSDAEQAALVANDFLDAILTEAQARAEGRAARTLEFFVSEEARINSEINAAESELALFKETNAASLPDNVANQRDRLRTLRERAITIEQSLLENAATNDRLRLEDVQRERALLEQQQALIEANISEIEVALDAAPEVERQLSGLTRRLEQLDTEYQAITASRTDAAMTQLIESQDQAERFEVLETAIEPEQPISASRRKIAIAGGIASGIVALSVALLLEVSHPVIRNAAQLEAQLGLRPVVTIPHLRTRHQRRRRKFGLAALLIAVFGVLPALAWWFRERIGDLVVAFPWQRLTDRI